MARQLGGVGGLALLLVIALGAMAVGFGLWFKIITIRSIVETGTVHAAVVRAFTDDDDVVDNPALDSGDTDSCVDIGGVDDADPFLNKDGDNNDRTSCDPAETGRDPKQRYDKDVARCDAAIAPNDNNVVQILKRNVYPSYHCTAWLAIHNDGTIPVKIVRTQINGQDVEPSQPTPFDLTGDGLPDVEVHVTDIRRCQQIDPDEIFFMNIDQHILQTAPQDATFGYSVEVFLAQWNEADQFECPSGACEGNTTDICVDADGAATAGDGIPGSVETNVGDALTAWPAPSTEGIDHFDNDADDTFSPGDDLHLEGGDASCPTGVRNAIHDLGEDCKVLDLNGDFADDQPVSCDLEQQIDFNGAEPGGCDPLLKFHDTNGSGDWDDGEDIIRDVNGNGIFD